MPKPTAPAAELVSTSARLGQLVRVRRKSQQLRIDDAAGLLGVSVDLLSRLENGKGSVRMDKIMTVLDGLGLQLLVVPKGHPWASEAASNSAEAPMRLP